MKSLLAILYLYQLCSASALEESDAGVSGDREGKVFSLFQLVKFQNNGCETGGARNNLGTCYTADECSTKGGTNDGTCAGGYGVCCVFRIGCGQKTSENCTILQPTLETMGARSCQYDVCRCNPNVCRIRFDLTKFQIAGPVEGLTVPELTDTPSTTNGASIGDCATDQFSVSSPGSFGSPVICGYNEGQHMFVDANEMCSKALFTFGSGTAMREWEIKVTQYACGDDNGGPPGCLQYHTGTVGSFASFNFPTADTMVGPTATHLSNQQYSICFRHEANKCAICYAPVIPGGAATDGPSLPQGSFGLSTTFSKKARGEWDQKCADDYLEIPGALHVTGNTPLVPGPVVAGTTKVRSRVCGRFLNIADGGADRRDQESAVCSQMRPFRVTFVTNGDEITALPDTIVTNPGDPRINEQGAFPGGIVGFNLNYQQIDCTILPVGAEEGLPSLDDHGLDSQLVQGGEPGQVKEVRDSDTILLLFPTDGPGYVIDGHLGGFEVFGGIVILVGQARWNNCSHCIADLAQDQLTV